MNFKIIITLVLFGLYYHSFSQHKHQGHHVHQDSTHNANDFMHKTPVAELIKRFESKDRDAYQQPEKVLQYLGNLTGKRIMDIGAGSGYFSVKLAEKGAIVTAADVNDEFLNYIKKRIEDNKLKNITVRKIPFDNPGLLTNEMDMVLIVNTYHHIEERSTYFSLVRKGINKDGELVIIDFFKTDLPVGPPVEHKVSIDEIMAELKNAGFTQFIVNVDLLPYQYIIKAK